MFGLQKLNLPQCRLVLDLLGKPILLLELLKLVVQRNDTLGRQFLDLLCPFGLPVPNVGCREGTQRSTSPDGRFDRRVEIGADDTAHAIGCVSYLLR
jgi:hypothetical protein